MPSGGGWTAGTFNDGTGTWASAVPADKAACEAVTALDAATACEAVTTAADPSVAACTYTSSYKLNGMGTLTGVAAYARVKEVRDYKNSNIRS